MSTEPDPIDLGFIEAGIASRHRLARQRALIALAVSAGITVIWLIYVTLGGHWDRVGRHTAAAVTMIFGSFVAGSTPQGGGAVAFPVFTKALGVSAEVARSFSLFIQVVGMGAASAAILIKRTKVEWRALVWGIPAAAITFVATIYGFGDRTDPFLRPLLPAAYVKVTFTLIVAAMAFITFLSSRIRVREVHTQIPQMNRRTHIALVLLAAIGGAAAALTGSGADVFTYLVLGVLLAVEVKVGVPTSVLIMACISLLGLVVLGLIEGQLAVEVAGDRVTAVGGVPVDLDASKADLFGMWLAAVPVVAWGAPAGAWVTSRVTSRQIVWFVVVLAAIEVITTALFVPELRSDPTLVTYSLVGGLVIGGGLWVLSRNRLKVFAQPGVAVDQTYSRRDLDVADGYRDALDPEGRFQEDG